MFSRRYEQVFSGDANWQRLEAPEAGDFQWQKSSTYIQEPPFFEGVSDLAKPVEDIKGARVLAFLGDSVTTDHISPAGSIPSNSPAASFSSNTVSCRRILIHTVHVAEITR